MNSDVYRPLKLLRMFFYIDRGIAVLGFAFLLMGCKTFKQPSPYVDLIVPTHSAGTITPAGSELVEVLPPQVTIDGGNVGEVRPTWTPLAGSVPDCVPPTGWVAYTVEKGNTLSAIAKWSGSTVAELAEVNCIENPTRIEIAQLIYVPREILPTSTPTVTPTPLPTETPTPTAEPDMSIDFFYAEKSETELVIRWQVVGKGHYRLALTDPEKDAPVVLSQGEQGEFTLKMALPDFDDSENNVEEGVVFTLAVTGKSGTSTNRSVKVTKNCVETTPPRPEDGCEG